MMFTAEMPTGRRLISLDRVESTNTEAMRLAAAGDAGGVWLVAGEQVKGRGRSGRIWTSVPGNLYASFMLRLACSPQTAQQLALLAGVAVVDAVRKVSDVGSDTLPALRLKWPNDVLIGSAKLCGILVESALNLGGPGLLAVIGVGLNVARAPEGLGLTATSLAAEGLHVDRGTMLTALAVSMDKVLSIWDEGAGFPELRVAWQERAGPIGEPLIVNSSLGPVRGCYSGLDQDGALLLADALGHQRRFTYGDVTLADGGSEQ